MKSRTLFNFFTLLGNVGFVLTNMRINDPYYWNAKKLFKGRFKLITEILVSDELIDISVNNIHIKSYKTTKKNLEWLIKESKRKKM